ncbi:MAG TPA: hypothetical protein VNM45_08585 [Bacillus sp. (in: firmicutes)]|nr:hypothetical protein [Bacillus sp. (in: firmicutes)]
MELIIKIMLSSTIFIAINFVTKSITSSNFDKLFIPKHQKILQAFCIYIVLFLLFSLYGVSIAAVYKQVRDFKYINEVTGIIVILNILGLITVGIICLIKRIIEKKKGTYYNFSEVKVMRLMFIPLILNALTYSIIIYEMYITTETDKLNYYSNLFICAIVFFMLTVFLFAAMTYLVGYKKKKWIYVISPTPEDVDKKYLHVLYAMSPTQLVLSENDVNIPDPTSVYIYDMSKQTFIHFERVVVLNKSMS